MSISVFILGIIIGGIGTLTSIIFAIISLVGGKTQRAAIWIVGFIVSISILIFCIIYVVRRIEDKAKNEIEWAVKQNQGLLGNDADSEKADQKMQRQNFLDTLQFYTNDNLKSKVPVEFYINKPAEKPVDSKIKVPFVYPLTINYNTIDFLGDLVNDAADSVYLTNISQMAFDQNFVIARLDNTGDKAAIKAGHAEVEYVLFDQRTREYLTFTTEQELLEKSGKIGYSGPASMNYLSDDYKGWTDSLNFDF